MQVNGLEVDRIELGDCLTWLKDVPDESVDLVVSSPPYNIGKEYETRRALDLYMSEQADVLAHCARVLRPTGSIFWQVGSYSIKGQLIPLDVKFFPILEELGMQPRNRIVWVRQHGLHAKNKFSARHETILWFSKSDSYKFNLDPIRVPQKYQNKKSWRGENKGELTCNPLGKNPGDIWSFQNVKHNHEEQTIHPAQFPEAMISRIILATTDESDVVLDPYMGTGTVAVAAKDLDRHYVGTEIDERYYELALQRIKVKPDADGIFPNLKTLRRYASETGTSASGYRFAVQVGASATDRTKAKIFDEAHHLADLEHRLDLEESAFADRLLGIEPPAFEAPKAPPTLFE
ncbi:modification methylase [Mycobacterium sp. ACS4054]|uniref:DNA-methyltransferase n=1 Tax=Mycobacterium sp. ACS4054 TaxID=1834119 RepID=UPI00080148A5|nr:site-specific DNA-methyltransferase [Mycobacterium sp. ACS4054]OBF06215.1 modification methylase [Mycobacterium sp. ACS4054]